MTNPSFEGVFWYIDMEDCETDRMLVFAIAGYENAQDVAKDLDITQHKANFLFRYINKRIALCGMKNYAALQEWAAYWKNNV